MITLAGPMRPHVVIARGVNGLPTAHLRGMGDGTCYDATSGDAIPCPDSGTDSSGGGGSSGGSSGGGASSPTNWAAIAAAITAASTGATNAIRATQSPYYLPNSTTLYNPATGQLTNAAGVTASSVASSATPLLIGMVFIGAVLIFALKKG